MVKVLTLQSMLMRGLLDEARGLNEEGHPGPAVVLAQAAAEVGMKRAVSFALELRETPEHLHEWIAMTAAGRSSWSPTSDNVSGLWTALTDDKLKAWPGWSAYKNGTKHRHRYIHEAGPVTSKQAESFIGAVERLLAHMQDAVAVWGKEWHPELQEST